jgi:hypothetical protein
MHHVDRLLERGTCGRCFDRGSVGGSIALVRRPGELRPRFVDLGRAPRSGRFAASPTVHRSSGMSHIELHPVISSSIGNRDCFASSTSDARDVDALVRGQNAADVPSAAVTSGSPRLARRLGQSLVGAVEQPVQLRLDGCAASLEHQRLVRRVGLLELREGRILERDSPRRVRGSGGLLELREDRLVVHEDLELAREQHEAIERRTRLEGELSARRLEVGAPPRRRPPPPAPSHGRACGNGIASDTSTVWPTRRRA